MPIVNFKGFIVDNDQDNWIVVRMSYGDGGPSSVMSTLVFFIGPLIQLR